ncbi:MAG TPA: serine hydrolase [Bacteroidales bacterium]|nr:serine hydrolase [Bacteroidales bacterium]HPI87532.1 serine hydrolase [Bacteroidales bacterium]
MHKKIDLLFALLLVSLAAFSQDKTPSFITDSLDNYIERSLRDWNIPGAAVAVVHNDRVVVTKGYGFLEMGKKDKVDENSLFMIASNTKAFTGTAIAILESEGKCSMDDRVQKYLPGFRMKDPWVAEHLTLTDVLSHRIGMETFQGDFMYWESELTSDQVVEKFGQLTPVYDYRAKWGYCNAGFLIAGMCLEAMTGASWDAFIRTRFLQPLEMNRTLALTSEVKNATNLASAHTLVDGKLQVIPHCRIDNLAPAASISSSVSDMSHWLIALLDSGRYGGRQVIPFKAIKSAQTPRSFVRKAGHPFNTAHYSLYGLGWDLRDYEGVEIVSHTGGVDGFVTSVTLIPEQDLGIVVLTNTDANGFYEALKWEIIDAYMDFPYRDYSRFYLNRYKFFQEQDLDQVNAWRDSVVLKLPLPVEMSRFEGRYVDEVYGYADLKAKGDHLVMTFQHHSDLTGKLEYIGNERFLCTYSHPLWGIKVFPFEIVNGSVKSFTLSVADFLEYTTYEFRKE